MQNKHLKFLVIIFVVAVIAPQIALAAWWNPFSWNWGWLTKIFSSQQQNIEQNNQQPQTQNEQEGEDPTANPPTQSQQATEGWKTYIDSQYGFEIKYPQNENVSLVDFIPSRGTNLILPDNNFIEKNGTIGGILNFFIFQKSTNNLEEYISDDLSAVNAVNDKYNLPRSSYEKININGITAYKINYPGGIVRIYMQNSAHTLFFQYDTKNDIIVQNIISTFKFTK